MVRIGAPKFEVLSRFPFQSFTSLDIPVLHRTERKPRCSGDTESQYITRRIFVVSRGHGGMGSEAERRRCVRGTWRKWGVLKNRPKFSQYEGEGAKKGDPSGATAGAKGKNGVWSIKIDISKLILQYRNISMVVRE